MRTRLAAALAALVTLAGAAGCGGSGGGSGKVTLTFWEWAPGFDKPVALWNKQHPGIQVRMTKIPGQGNYAKMRAALKAGNAPDLVQMEYDAVPGFLLDGGLENLSKYGADRYRGKFVDWQWQQASFGGNLYAVPQASGPMAMFYRKDLLDKWGIQPPTTWTDYEKAAEKIRAHGAYIATFSPKAARWFAGLSWQAGARWFGSQGDTWTVGIDGPQTQRVAAYWNDMVRKGLVKTEPDMADAWYKDIQDGKIVTWVNADWGDALLRQNAPGTSGKWRVAPMPQWQAGQQAAGDNGGSTTAVLKGSAHPKEALKFAVWLNTDPKSVGMLIQGGYGWPAAKGVFAGSALDRPDPFFGGQNYNTVFAVADEHIDKNWTWSPTFTQTVDHFTDGFKGVLNGHGTLGQAVTGVQRQTLADLRAKGLKAAPR